MKKNATRYPPISDDVYSRFSDDGWGIRNVKRTKRGEEILKKLEDKNNGKKRTED